MSTPDWPVATKAPTRIPSPFRVAHVALMLAAGIGLIAGGAVLYALAPDPDRFERAVSRNGEDPEDPEEPQEPEQ